MPGFYDEEAAARSMAFCAEWGCGPDDVPADYDYGDPVAWGADPEPEPRRTYGGMLVMWTEDRRLRARHFPWTNDAAANLGIGPASVAFARDLVLGGARNVHVTTYTVALPSESLA